MVSLSLTTIYFICFHLVATRAGFIADVTDYNVTVQPVAVDGMKCIFVVFERIII